MSIDHTANNFRSVPFNDTNSFQTTYVGDQFLHTPFAGNVRALAPPPLPQPPTQSAMFNNYYSSMGGMNNMYGGYGGYSGGFGAYGGMYNRFSGYGGGNSMNALDPENRFIQLAEANARPAFQSIESLVGAVSNIAGMLDSTFFALTSSFRAILGVAANFGRLRGVFTQFWQTFILFRGLNWLYRKILHWLHISKVDTSQQALSKTISDSLNNGPPLPPKGHSPWPVLAFLSFISMAPYLVMKLLGTVTQTAQEEARNPSKWVRPIQTIALYDFQARNQNEISFLAGQSVVVAPKEIQNNQILLNTGWALASVDGQNSGLIPLNYVKSPKHIRADQANQKLELDVPFQESQQIPHQQFSAHSSSENVTTPTYARIPSYESENPIPKYDLVPTSNRQPEIDLSSLNVSAFAPPPPLTMQKAQDKSASIIDIATTKELNNE